MPGTDHIDTLRVPLPPPPPPKFRAGMAHVLSESLKFTFHIKTCAHTYDCYEEKQLSRMSLQKRGTNPNPHSCTSSAGTYQCKTVFKSRQGLANRSNSSLDPGFSELVFLQAAHHKAIFSLSPLLPSPGCKITSFLLFLLLLNGRGLEPCEEKGAA